MLTTPLFFQHHRLTLSDPVSLNLRGQSSGAVQTTNDLPAGCISVSPQSQTPFKGMFSCAQSMLSHGETSVIDKEHREAEEPLLVQITHKGQWYNPQCKNILQPCWENMGPTQLQSSASWYVGGLGGEKTPMGTESEGVCSALLLTRDDLMGLRHEYQ